MQYLGFVSGSSSNITAAWWSVATLKCCGSICLCPGDQFLRTTMLQDGKFIVTTVYKYDIISEPGRFFLSRLMWFERAVSLLGLFHDFSITFSCPFHCGYSLVLPWLFGLLSGFVLGIVSGLCLLCYLRHPILIAPSAQQSAESPAAPLRRRSNRLASYVYE